MNKVTQGVIDTTVESAFIKPCPICKRSPEVIKDEIFRGIIGWYLICKCNQIYESEQEAIEAWNK